jgi:hypothetical protein
LISPLNIEALDVNIEIGADEPDKNKIISKLVGEEKLNYEVFVENSPETVLPINLDVELVTSSEPWRGWMSLVRTCRLNVLWKNLTLLSGMN